jgi:hypothetical protein
MDGDDVCHPDRIGEQVAWLDSHPEVDLLATGAWVIDENNVVVGARHQFGLPRDGRSVLGHGFLLQPSVMARKAWFADNPYDSKYLRAEDKELWCRTWRVGKFDRLPQPLLFYREASRLRTTPYRLGVKSDRMIIRRYGPEIVGRVGVARMLLRSHAVEVLTVAAHHVGLDSAVIRLRADSVGDSDLADAQRLLDTVITRI